MKTFPLSFTDAFGIAHPNAVAMIAAVNQQAAINIDTAGAETDGYSALTYQVRFWHSEEVRAAGAQPQMFTHDGMMGVLTVTGEAALLPRTGWLDACRAHFEAAIAPTLKPAV